MIDTYTLAMLPVKLVLDFSVSVCYSICDFSNRSSSRKPNSFDKEISNMNTQSNTPYNTSDEQPTSFEADLKGITYNECLARMLNILDTWQHQNDNVGHLASADNLFLQLARMIGRL